MQDHEVGAYREIRTAIKQGRLSDVVRLIGNDQSRLRMDTPFGTWLHMAAAHGKLDIAQWLISQGVDVNARASLIEGRPLDEACAKGHMEVAKYLIDSGATLDVSEAIRNPLFSTIVGGRSESHTAVAKLLIDSGIDTTVRYPHLDNMNALEYAREWGRKEIVKLLNQN